MLLVLNGSQCDICGLVFRDRADVVVLSFDRGGSTAVAPSAVHRQCIMRSPLVEQARDSFAPSDRGAPGAVRCTSFGTTLEVVDRRHFLNFSVFKVDVPAVLTALEGLQSGRLDQAEVVSSHDGLPLLRLRREGAAIVSEFLAAEAQVVSRVFVPPTALGLWRELLERGLRLP